MVHLPWLLFFPRAFVLAPRTSPFVLPGLNLTVVGGLGHRLFRAAFWAPEPPRRRAGWMLCPFSCACSFSRLTSSMTCPHLPQGVSFAMGSPLLVLSSEGSIRILTTSRERHVVSSAGYGRKDEVAAEIPRRGRGRGRLGQVLQGRSSGHRRLVIPHQQPLWPAPALQTPEPPPDVCEQHVPPRPVRESLVVPAPRFAAWDQLVGSRSTA